MKITILSVGRPGGVLAEAIRDYESRAARYWKLETVEVAQESGPRDDVTTAEGRRLLERVPDRHLLWALTRTGKGIGSEGLASYLEKLAVESAPGIAFVVGGAYGLSREVVDRADRKLSLSPMTLPHDLARFVLLEQIYRAGTIRRNEPYHKRSFS